MKILVTGSNGLLGRKLTDLYRNRKDVSLIATGKGENRSASVSGYTYETLDITDQGEVESVIGRHKPDIVINTAAMTNVDLCETDRAGCDALNVKAVQYLVRSCAGNGSRLIHLSTDFIFNGTHGPVKEEEEPDPLSYYGLSKLKAEEIVMGSGIDWAIVRTVLVYGVVEDMSRSNIVLWVKGNLESGREISVVGDQFRSPTLAEDLAAGCALIADKKAKGIYNLGGIDFMSVFDIAYRVADFWKLDKSLLKLSTSEGIKQPARRPPITGLSIDKAKKELGYDPRSFEAGLALIDQQLQAIKKTAN